MVTTHPSLSSVTARCPAARIRSRKSWGGWWGDLAALRARVLTLSCPADLTIGVEFGARMVTIDKKQIKLQIWDTVPAPRPLPSTTTDAAREPSQACLSARPVAARLFPLTSVAPSPGWARILQVYHEVLLPWSRRGPPRVRHHQVGRLLTCRWRGGFDLPSVRPRIPDSSAKGQFSRPSISSESPNEAERKGGRGKIQRRWG